MTIFVPTDVDCCEVGQSRHENKVFSVLDFRFSIMT